MMYSLKLYIIKIIAIVAVLQIGGLFINKPSFARLYTLTGAIILITALFSFPDIDFNLPKVNVSDNSTLPAFEDAFKKTFENNLADKITNSIYKNFNLNCKVDIETDMEHMEIYVLYDSKNISPDELSDYIKSVYCTQNDRVVINNE